MAAAASEMVEEAIAKAQHAVTADTAGEFDKAIELYKISVDLIKRGMQAQRGDEGIDVSVLQRYEKLYSERIAKLLEHTGSAAKDESARMDFVGAGGASGSFSFADVDEITQRTPPPAPPPEAPAAAPRDGPLVKPRGHAYSPARSHPHSPLTQHVLRHRSRAFTLRRRCALRRSGDARSG